MCIYITLLLFFQAIAFGTCFIIGSNGASTWGVNQYFIAPDSPNLNKAFSLELTPAQSATLLARNALGFATLLALWHASTFVSRLLEAQLCGSKTPGSKLLPRMVSNI